MLGLLDSVLFESLPYIPMALGLVITYRYLRTIDLTFAASFLLGPAVIGATLVHGRGFFLGLVGGTAATIALVALTIYLVQHLKLDSLLAGIVSSFAGYAIALLFTQGTLPLGGYWTPLVPLQQMDAGIEGPVPFHWWEIAAFAAVGVLVKVAVDIYLGSEHGLAFRAMEDERSRHRLLGGLGFSPERLEAGALLAGNLLCMMSGTIAALKATQVNAELGFDAVVTVITSFLLGSTLFERRSLLRRPVGTVSQALAQLRRLTPTMAAVAGVFLYYAVVALVSLLPVPASAPKLLLAALLVAAFAASRRLEVGPLRRNAGSIEATGPSSAFEVESASVSYPGDTGPITVLRNAHFRVDAGEVVQLLGTNGQGKTTLFRFLAGQLPGEGMIRIPAPDGVLVVDRRTSVGLVSQDATTATCGTLTAEEHLALYRIGRNAHYFRPWRAAVRNLKTRIPGTELFKRFDGKPVAALSGGQRQLISIGAFFTRDDPPPVILFDEPLSYLDDENARGCVDLIRCLRDDGRRIVLVQHDLAPAEDYRGAENPRASLARLITRRVAIDEIQSLD